MTVEEQFPPKVRDFIRTHDVPIFVYPYLEATDDLLRRRRGIFGEYMLFVIAIVEKDRHVVLIQQHSGVDMEGGFWLFPGGAVERDEAIPDAAIREVKEETGLDVELLDPVGVIKTGRHASTKGAIDAFFAVFAAHAIGGDLRPMDLTEIAAVRLATVEEIEGFYAAGVFGGSNRYFQTGAIECLRRWAAGRNAGGQRRVGSP